MSRTNVSSRNDSHPYFTKRAWNVVQAYIEHFSEPGDLVLDPFGGSGVTATEALVLGRRAIHVDISPLANLIARGIALSPVDLTLLGESFEKVRAASEDRIRALYKLSDEAIELTDVPYWYPAGVPLPPNSDAETIDELFHRRSLIGLSILLHHINELEDETYRFVLRLVFCSTLTKTNLTFSSTAGRKDSRGDSGIFRVYRYWIPNRKIELNVWEQFELRYKGWAVAKAESNQVIGNWFSEPDTIMYVEGSATDLSEVVEDESVDYIYTDPPYGAHIAYLDLSAMWNAWMGFDITDEARELEVIEGGSLGKDLESYTSLLDESIREMFRVLKWGRWLSIVFAHKDTGYWDSILQSAQRSGFEYVNTVVQPSTTPSLHKRKNPLSVLSGELVLNFRKVKSPKTVAITEFGGEVVQLIRNTAELAIVQRGGATTEEVFNVLIPVLLENGLLAEVRAKIPDVTELLASDFDFSDADGRWHVRANTELGHFIPLSDRIRFYLTDCLKRWERDGKSLTFDDIVFEVMPSLVNGKQPSDHSILEVLEEIAYSPDEQHWLLKTGEESGQVGWTFEGLAAIPQLAAVKGEVPHDEIIYRIAKLGGATGLIPHVGKNEQPSQIHGERLGDLGEQVMPSGFSTSAWMKSKIEQIDCLLLRKDGTVAFAFEVEASTPITTGIDRFLELLTARPETAGRLVVVIPRRRQKKLTQILGESHYIGHPMYIENKLAWLYYEDLLKLYDRFAGKNPPKPEQLEEIILKELRRPSLG